MKESLFQHNHILFRERHTSEPGSTVTGRQAPAQEDGARAQRCQDTRISVCAFHVCFASVAHPRRRPAAGLMEHHYQKRRQQAV